MKKSESIKELSIALNSFQASIKGAMKDSENPYFNSKYVSLSAVWKLIQAPLTENGLSISQFPIEKGITNILMHISGEWIEADMIMEPVKNNPMGIGSLISFARRYALCSILGIVADDDDDGNTASIENANSADWQRSLNNIKDIAAKKVLTEKMEIGLKNMNNWTYPQCLNAEKMLQALPNKIENF